MCDWHVYNKLLLTHFCLLTLGHLGVTYALHLWLVGKPVVDFIFVVIELFRYLLLVRRYERKSVDVGVFRRGWVTLSADFRGKGASPTNHCWCQKTRVIAVSCGIKRSAVLHLVLSQYTCPADGQSDGRTDRQNCDSNIVRCITCSRTVKTFDIGNPEKSKTVGEVVRLVGCKQSVVGRFHGTDEFIAWNGWVKKWWWMAKLVSKGGVYTPCLKKNCAKLFLSELRQISTNFDNFWQKDDKEAKIMGGALTIYLIKFASSHYRVKRISLCTKLLHNAQSCYLQ